MTEFEYLGLGIALILGLGVTMLLTSFLALFTKRRHIKMDWIPIAWACYIFIIQVQYYHACWSLNTNTEWTFVTFAAPLLLAGLIFLAAGLVLPSAQGDHPSDLGAYFQQHGKWAVAALALRGVVAIVANLFVFGNNVSSGVLFEFILAHQFHLAQIASALFFLFSRKRPLQVVSTVLYGIVLLFTLLILYL